MQIYKKNAEQNLGGRQKTEYGADPKGIEKLWEKYQRRREEYEETKRKSLT